MKKLVNENENPYCFHVILRIDLEIWPTINRNYTIYYII